MTPPELDPLYRRSLQAYLSWQKQTRHWIDDSAQQAQMIETVRTSFALFNDARLAAIRCSTHWPSKELLNSGGNSGARRDIQRLTAQQWLAKSGQQTRFEVGKTVATTPGSVMFRNELLGADPIQAHERKTVRQAPADRAATVNKVLHF